MDFSRIFDNMDVFRQPIKLTMNHSDTYRTKFGSIISLLVVILTILQSLSAIHKVLNHEYPNLDSIQQSTDEPGLLHLNSSNFLFAITVQNTDFDFSSAYVNFQMEMRKYVRQSNGTIQKIITPVPLKICDLDYMANYSSKFSKVGLHRALCPTIPVYDIEGGYLNDVFQFIKLSVVTCMNDTKQPDIICKDSQAVQDALINNQVTVALIFTQNTVDENNYESPVQQYLYTLNWDTNPGVNTLSTDLFLNEYQISTDDGLWSENWSVTNQTTHLVDVPQERMQFSSVDYIDSTNYEIFKLYFRKSNNIVRIRRVFPKIQQMMATIGGIFSLIMTLAGIVMMFYTRHMYYTAIADRLYEFQTDEKKDEPQDLPSSYTPCKNIARNFVKYSEKGMMKLNYNFFDYIYSVTFGLCCPRRKEKLCKKGIELVKKDIDILQIVRRLQELEKLKLVLLNEDQINVFSYTRRPLIKEKDVEEDELRKRLRRKSKKKQKPNVEAMLKFRRSLTKSQRRRALVERGSHHHVQTSYDQENIYDLNRFMTLFDSYRKIANVENRTLFDEKILNLLDQEMHETLYDLDLEMRKGKHEFYHEYYMNFTFRVFEELLHKVRNPRRYLSRAVAAGIITKRLQRRIQETRKKLLNEGIKTLSPTSTQQVISKFTDNLIERKTIQEPPALSIKARQREHSFSEGVNENSTEGKPAAKEQDEMKRFVFPTIPGPLDSGGDKTERDTSYIMIEPDAKASDSTDPPSKKVIENPSAKAGENSDIIDIMNSPAKSEFSGRDTWRPKEPDILIELSQPHQNDNSIPPTFEES